MNEASALPGLFAFVLSVVVLLVIFLCIREIVLWYFRINESVQIAKESRDYLRELVRLASAEEEIEDEEAQALESEAELRQRQLPVHFRRWPKVFPGKP